MLKTPIFAPKPFVLSYFSPNMGHLGFGPLSPLWNPSASPSGSFPHPLATFLPLQPLFTCKKSHFLPKNPPFCPIFAQTWDNFRVCSLVTTLDPLSFPFWLLSSLFGHFPPRSIPFPRAEALFFVQKCRFCPKRQRFAPFPAGDAAPPSEGGQLRGAALPRRLVRRLLPLTAG